MILGVPLRAPSYIRKRVAAIDSVTEMQPDQPWKGHALVLRSAFCTQENRDWPTQQPSAHASGLRPEGRHADHVHGCVCLVAQMVQFEVSVSGDLLCLVHHQKNVELAVCVCQRLRSTRTCELL